MGVLDKLDNSCIDVRSVVSEKNDDEVEIVEVPLSDSGHFVKTHTGFRIWMMLLGDDYPDIKNVTTVNKLLNHYFSEITTVKKWSKQIYIVGRFREILIGFNPEVRTVRSGIRLIFSILNILRREHGFGGIVQFMYRNDRQVYKIIYTLNFMDTFDQKDVDNSGLREFLNIICQRDITDRQYKKAIDGISNSVFRSRQINIIIDK